MKKMLFSFGVIFLLVFVPGIFVSPVLAVSSPAQLLPDAVVFSKSETLNITSMVRTDPATEVGPYSVELNGTVTSLGLNDRVRIYFEFGPTTDYQFNSSFGSNSRDKIGSFSYSLITLPNTLYHYRAVIRSDSEGIIAGQDMIVTSTQDPPRIVTTSVSNLGVSSATLNAQLVFMGSTSSVNVNFEYGTSIQYGDVTAFQSLNHREKFLAEVTGLLPNTTYHFRAVADGGAAGITPGNDLTIITGAPAFTGKIAYDTNGMVFMINADGSGQTRLTSYTADNRVSENYAPSCSPDGTEIAFHASCDYATPDVNCDTYSVDLAGHSTRLTTDSHNDAWPDWSPDGNKIAFDSNRNGNWEIYTMNTDGSGQTRLTNNPVPSLNPRWLADGTLAFTANRDGTYRTYLIDADGSNERIYSGPEGVWSPDGKKIAFYSYMDGNPGIYVADADGSSPVRLTNTWALDYDPSWSPDSKKIVFISNRSDNYEMYGNIIKAIYIMNADGSNLTQITPGAEVNTDPHWITDARPGDASGDGFINMGDVTKVERIILGIDLPTGSCDANGDGNVDMGDVIKIERIILKLDP